MFFQARDGYSYPVRDIIRFGLPHDHVVMVELTDERTVQVDDFRLDGILQHPVAAFAAQLGTYVVATMAEGDELYRSPVVGWAVLAGGSVRPITPLGMNDGDIELQPVQTPDGKVLHYGLNENIEEWLASKREQESM